MRPVTTMVQQTQYVPYTSYRLVYSAAYPAYSVGYAAPGSHAVGGPRDAHGRTGRSAMLCSCCRGPGRAGGWGNHTSAQLDAPPATSSMYGPTYGTPGSRQLRHLRLAKRYELRFLQHAAKRLELRKLVRHQWQLGYCHAGPVTSPGTPSSGGQAPPYVPSQETPRISSSARFPNPPLRRPDRPLPRRAPTTKPTARRPAPRL